jgi:two-component system phosphate regulon sensor histidine kinase PhoR
MAGSRLFWKLYAGYVVLVVATVLIVGGVTGHGVERDVLRETRRDLARAAAALREMTRDFPADPSSAELERLRERVERLGRETGIRFTVITPDGSVRADSDGAPVRMDDHSTRPEIVAAARDGVGVATRESDPLGSRQMYVAMPAGDAGFVRAAVSLDAIDERRLRLRRRIAIGGIIAAAVALLVGLPFGRSFTAPLVKMSQAARSIAVGDYHRRLSIDRSDEIGAFALSFNVMAGTLQERIETLTEERNRLFTVLSSMVEGVVAVDAAGRVILMNDPAGDILGAVPEEAPGRPFGTVTRVREVVEGLSDTLTSGIERSRETLLPGAAGDRVLEIHTAPIHGAGGENAGAVVVLHDVTELRRLEGVRRDFVANVSHELKTPLTVVRGIVETLLGDASMEERTRERFLEKVRLQAERLSSIVSDLLSLARIESGGGATEMRTLDLRELVRESARALTPSAESRGVRLEEELADGTVPVEGNWSSLRLALDNLLDNAVKYTRAGGRVTLRLAVDGDTALVDVADTGIGIASEHGDRVFERFYRVDKARSRELGGTGLGLSIVRNVMTAHGGQVEYESAPGEGSTFRIRLPLRGIT